MYVFDRALRDRLFAARLTRQLGHHRVVEESGVTRRLHRELHEALEESRRLRRRARWLCETKSPLPRRVR